MGDAGDKVDEGDKHDEGDKAVLAVHPAWEKSIASTNTWLVC